MMVYEIRENHKDNSPVFIVGCGRSGTTLLRVILNRHSHFAIPEETWFFRRLSKKQNSIIDEKDPEWREKVAELLSGYPVAQFHNITQKDVQEGLSSCDVNDLPCIFSVVHRLFAQKENKPRWGDKTPGYVINLNLIKQLFPNAKVIHIIRDGRDVTLSMLQYPSVGPETTSFLETALYWRYHVKKGRTDGPYLFGDNYKEVYYESLVREPEKTIKEICEFIGENFEPKILRQEEKVQEYVPDWSWHQQLRKPINSEKINKWEHKMSSYEKSLFDLACGDTLKRLRYQKSKILNARSCKDWLVYLVRIFYQRSLLKIKRTIYYTLR